MPSNDVAEVNATISEHVLPEALTAPELDPVFWAPARMGATSAWWGHVPFGHWVTSVLRPRVIVELGNNNGVSFAAFCEAMLRRKITGRCYAVDPWSTREKGGYDFESAFLDFEAFNRARYGEFSTLMRTAPDAALPRFSDGSIDLFHIDYSANFQALKRDFDAWRPKLSERAIVLIHGINASEQSGAGELWAALKAGHAYFEFPHGGGLGVLAIGPDAPTVIRELVALAPGAAQLLRERFALLGAQWEAPAEFERRARALAEAERQRVLMEGRVTQLALSDDVTQLRHQIRGERSWNLGASEREKLLQSELAAIYASRTWRTVQSVGSARRGWRTPVKTLKSIIAPAAQRANRDIELIANSGLFDESFYGGTEGARAAGVSPIEHYIRQGEAAGLAPSSLFDPSFYLETYPDLSGAGAPLLVHYLRYGKHEGRRARSLVNSLHFPTDRLAPDRETIVVAIHEASRTGAPILAWNIIGELQKRYNVIALLREGGQIEQEIADASSGVVSLPENFIAQPVEMEALAEKFAKLYAPKYFIANSLETRYFVPSFERAGIPTIALVVEFCNAKPFGTLHALFESASQIVFEAQIVADSGLQDYRILEARDYKILPQGASRLPRNNREAEPDKKAAKDDFSGLPPKDGTILVVGMGTINLRKGVDFFIAAAASVRRQRPSLKIKFAWVGKAYRLEQEYLDYLNEQIKRSEVGASFVFLGEFEDLKPIYARADICFLSSRMDALPNIAIDSAIHGVPIICFDQASGMADILKASPETQDLVIPYLDPDAAARLVIEMADAPTRLSAYSEAMRRIAAEHFDMVRYVESLDRLGRKTVAAVEQEKRDFALIAQSGAFNAQLFLGTAASTMSADEALRKYLRGSRFAAPRGRPWTHLLVRRPAEGFHPLVYASDNPAFDETSGEDPFAHYISTGFPAGRWKHDVIRPDANEVASDNALRVAVHGHFHYPDLLDDFIARLRLNRTSCDLLLTTSSGDRADAIKQTLARLNVDRASIEITPNRGRDIGPLLTGFGSQRLAQYDVVGHFHSKKSAYMEASIGEVWRSFLWEHLVGGKHNMMDVVIRAFARDETLGLVFPEDPHLNDWNEDRAIANGLAQRMGLASPLPNHFDFPNGTMFWARPRALKPLMDLGIAWSDYPEEPLPMDGTLLHTLERFLSFSASHAGYRYATTYVRDSVR
jgi:glycosyltransferase involved in cell wall biosynthesis